jgi:hypothetical protein
MHDCVWRVRLRVTSNRICLGSGFGKMCLTNEVQHYTEGGLAGDGPKLVGNGEKWAINGPEWEIYLL